jgi:hypothetical protein
MTPEIHATHHSAEIDFGGYRVKVPGAVGKPEMKNLNHKVRNQMFNESLAKAWLKETEAGRTRFHAVLETMRKKINKNFERLV